MTWNATFPGGPASDLEAEPEADLEYRRLHSERSAEIVGRWLSGEGANEELVGRRRAADPRARDRRRRRTKISLQAADSLSFLEVNAAGRRRLVHERPLQPGAVEGTAQVDVRADPRRRVRAISRSRSTRRRWRLSTEPEWLVPASLDEALALKAERRDHATVVAGGTFVGILVNSRLLAAEAFLSLQFVAGIDDIDADGELRLGALTTHRAVELVAGRARRLAGAGACVLGRRQPARSEPGDGRRRARRRRLRVRPAVDVRSRSARVPSSQRRAACARSRSRS